MLVTITFMFGRFDQEACFPESLLSIKDTARNLEELNVAFRGHDSVCCRIAITAIAVTDSLGCAASETFSPDVARSLITMMPNFSDGSYHDK